MDNHYHLVIETPEPNLSRGVRRLHGTYMQWFNRRHHRVGHVLQGRYKSLLVEKERYLLELCRYYVVLNPVRAGMVREAGEWGRSSYRATAGMQAVPDWLHALAVWSLFNASVSIPQAAYSRFVAEGVSQPAPWKDVSGQIFLGSPTFLERIEGVVRGKSLANVPSAHSRPTRLSADEVLKRVAATYQVRVGDLLERAHRDAYHTAVYLLRRAENDPLQHVAVRFRLSPSRVSKIQRMVESRSLTPEQVDACRRCKIKI